MTVLLEYPNLDGIANPLETYKEGYLLYQSLNILVKGRVSILYMRMAEELDLHIYFDLILFFQHTVLITPYLSRESRMVHNHRIIYF